MLRIWKSTVRWRASSSRVTASCVSSIFVTSSTATVMLRRKRCPKRRRPPVCRAQTPRHPDPVHWAMPPFAHHPIT